MIRYFFIFMTIAGSGCQEIQYLVKNRELPANDISLFQQYSGRICLITDASGAKTTEVNCEELAGFLYSDDAYCNTPKFSPSLAYFPDQTKPMNLCRSYTRPQRENKEILRFVVFGDSGAGQNSVEGYEQIAVAKAMQKICPATSYEQPNSGGTQQTCDFALVVGDLIYPNGAESVWDRQLQSRFEDIYEGFGEFDFYIVPGNHDHRGSVTAQSEYTFFSNRWRMLDRHFSVPSLPAWLKIYGLDTNPLVESGVVDLVQASQLEQMKNYLGDKNEWKFVWGHHPAFSSGEHGAEQNATDLFANLSSERPFDILFSGHDHDLEVIQSDLFMQVVSGGGGARVKNVSLWPDEVRSYESRSGGQGTIRQLYAKKTHGFLVVEASKESVSIYVYDVDRFGYNGQKFSDEPAFNKFDYKCTMTNLNKVCTQSN